MGTLTQVFSSNFVIERLDGFAALGDDATDSIRILNSISTCHVSFLDFRTENHNWLPNHGIGCERKVSRCGAPAIALKPLRPRNALSSKTQFLRRMS